MRKTKSEGKTVGIFANCSQCVANFAMRNFAMRKTTANFAMRKTIWQCENPFGNAKNHLAMRKIIWQCEKPFGNAKNHLAMRKTIWQFRNAKFRNTTFAVRKFRNAKIRNAKISQYQFRNAKFSQCQFRSANFIFALPNSLHLRNSHLQALSSSVINAEPP